ncbi:hypothetical protein E4U41_002368 [Claviceps citrina]|nr:hypothetical protein E4U41_002368 [Claviceps citrina]
MSSTMVMRPCTTAAFERMPDLYAIPDDNIDQRKSPLPALPLTCGAKGAAYPMYPGLQMPKADGTRSADSPPVTLNRPRRLSGMRPEHGQTGRPSSIPPQEPLILRATSPPWRTTSYVTTRTPPKLKKQRGRSSLGDLCGALPGEVLEVILEMLKQLHLGRGSESCATCWMRDASSAALCSRKWYKAARLALYQDIQLIGPDSAAHKKRFKTAQGCRITLLRRTLRADAELASVVRSLKLPTPDTTTPSSSSNKGQALLEQYENVVASVVMACPNLERLSGPIVGYNHSFKRLFQALSTRSNLKHMDWLIDSTGSLPTQQQQAASGSNKHNGLSPHQAQLQPHQETAFLEQHRAWTKLTSLSVQCLPDAILAPQTLLARTLTVLPSLQHLHLHDLASSAFDDSSLVDLPPLQSLTLSNISGISSNGLSAFATRANSQPLRNLVLSHTPLTSLPALARILSNLTSLASLSLVQSFPPLMPDSDSFVLWMMPYLASSSVSKLHWDISSHPDGVNAADEILARSIAAGGFPSLRLLRAPNDAEGIFQQLCRPVERIDLPGDRFRRMSVCESGTTARWSPTKSLVKSSTTSSLPSMICPSPHTSLVTARLAAQARLERSREAHLFHVKVTDEQGDLVESFGLSGYMGTVGSKINYHLLPDPGSRDELGGLAGVSAPSADRGEALGLGCQGCTGSWNRREGVVADKKDKERWWHTERGRWRDVV